MTVQRYDIEVHHGEYPPAEMVESFDGRYVLHTDYAAIEARCAGLEQVSADLCPDCGWAMKFPDEPCRNCEVHVLRKDCDALQAKLAAAEEALRQCSIAFDLLCKAKDEDRDSFGWAWDEAWEKIEEAQALADTTTGEVQP